MNIIINFILNQIPNFDIKSQSKLIDDTFTSLHKLFGDEMMKIVELPYQMFGSVIKICKMEQRQSTNEHNIYYKRGMYEYLRCVDISILCHVIKIPWIELNI